MAQDMGYEFISEAEIQEKFYIFMGYAAPRGQKCVI
jgi:hypothetical protein